MKANQTISLSLVMFLAVSVAFAKESNKGGLPQCKADLAVCNSDLGQEQADSVACQNNLTTCQDSLAAIEPEILVIVANFTRIDADAASGDGVSTVRNNCGGGVEGWNGATAGLKISQYGSSSKVEIELEGGAPDTLYDVWVRMKGQAHGTTFGGSPITGGGATPLSHSSNLDQLVADWIGAGSPASANAFNTDANGDGTFEAALDFPVVGGAYPFNRMSHAALLDAQTKNPAATPSPTAIVNPADFGVGPGGTPFMIRVISHCQDGLTHGLSPAKREAWFQYP